MNHTANAEEAPNSPITKQPNNYAMTGDFAPYTSTGGTTTFGYIHCEDLKYLLQRKQANLAAADVGKVARLTIKFETKGGELGMRFAVMLDRVVCMVVQPAGNGYKAGLREGDVLQRVNGVAIQADVVQVVHQIKFGTYPMHMDVERNGRLEGRILNGRLVVKEFKPLSDLRTDEPKCKPVSLEENDVSIPFSWLKELCHHLPPESGGGVDVLGPGRKSPPKAVTKATQLELSLTCGEQVCEDSDTMTLITRYREYIVDSYVNVEKNGDVERESNAVMEDLQAMRDEGALNAQQYSVAMQELTAFDDEIKELGTDSLVKVAQEFV